MSHTEFAEQFRLLMGFPPMPWQMALYRDWFAQGEIPTSCDLQTGLGKTSVMALWLIALANGAPRLPRRLIYVVNRRTVVDQATREAERLRDNLKRAGLTEPLQALCALNHDVPLAISTLRGQFADNGEWSIDPARPAIVVGTVDMIGSRLLFSGYRIGFRSRPLHAGFLGQDALLVHDEAHLEPAFQKLVETIREEQDQRERVGDLPWPKLRVLALSATTRRTDANGGNGVTFGLTVEEKDPPEHLPEPPAEPIHLVWKRLKARKALTLHKAGSAKDAVVKEIASLAATYKDCDAAVLIFVRTPEDVTKVCEQLTSRHHGVESNRVRPLTGTMRGYERDDMADPRRPDTSSRVFARFLEPPKPDAPDDERWKVEHIPGTVYLVCTSAGEVGIDISAHHLVCDLSTFESMAQRFGRVNRYGKHDDTRIHVVYPAEFDEKDKLTPARRATLKLLEKLEGDASPWKLSTLVAQERQDAFAPEPTILPATDILFDAWALTSIGQPFPGRPPIEPYLHGLAEWEPPETQVAWRREVEILQSTELLDRYPPEDLLAAYPLKPRELLRDRTDRVYAALVDLITPPKVEAESEEGQRRIERALRNAEAIVWLIDKENVVTRPTLRKLLNDDKQRVMDRLAHATVLLPPFVGGLEKGMLNPESEQANDVADIQNQRVRIHPDDPDLEVKQRETAEMRRVCAIELGDAEDDDDEPRLWEWYEKIPLEGGRSAQKTVPWNAHTDDVVHNAERIVARLSLPQELADAVVLAAALHDRGKQRQQFQLTLGNRAYPNEIWAKADKHGARLPEPFRHEFASVLDAQADGACSALGDEMKDLVLHLIAAHHGRARPHFSEEEAFDPERKWSEAQALAVEIPRRFARLQRKYGRWGLAYLESLLRAADWAASANPSLTGCAEVSEAKS